MNAILAGILTGGRAARKNGDTIVMLVNSEATTEQKNKRVHRHSVLLMVYDAALLLTAVLLLLVIYPSEAHKLTHYGLMMQTLLCVLALFACRLLFGIYNHVWRYGGTTLYLRLILADALAGALYYIAGQLFLPEKITFIRAVAVVSVNLLMNIGIRLVYQYLYDYNNASSPIAAFLRRATSIFTGLKYLPEQDDAAKPCKTRINIAIVGAGRVGVMLAEELLNNPGAYYKPCMFIENDREKIGRYIFDLRVYSEAEVTPLLINSHLISEIVFAVPNMDAEEKKCLYEKYKDIGCKIKVYDFPTAENLENGRRKVREFDVHELLFRAQLSITDEATSGFYRDKVVLITGGGGSIGSELCRQVAKMHPQRLIILDIYENGAYDIQQELSMLYDQDLDLIVEIASICDRRAMEKILELHRPHVILHAAAHKHVPLMERNCSEAVQNNVFGTLNMVECAEACGVQKFILISTDKAVNPTNIMGASKRVCEMIVQNRSGGTSFSAVRFGNVLGSNGSVIPLFKRQIENGGPVTITDKRIIRYFMTIPEASQLVLTSGAMAKNGEIYVLDMGYPVKILDLAENMIRLSGYTPYTEIKIVETGLRPGEKLFEELLIDADHLVKTSNELIFVEKDELRSPDHIAEKLGMLRNALNTGSSESVRAALMKVVPTFHDPDDVNCEDGCSEEIKKTRTRKWSVKKLDPTPAVQ